jgi:hypothetical protein
MRRLAVNVMQPHVCFDSRLHQTFRCLQHEIIPFANCNFLFCCLLCLIHAYRSASFIIDYEIRAVLLRYPVFVGHRGCSQAANIVHSVRIS